MLESPIVRLMALLVAMVGLSTWGMTYLEGMTAPDALWWTIVTMTTVGYGDISPKTHAGRMVAVVLMVVGIGIVSMLTALVASALVERRLRRNKGMETYDLRDHFVIVGWGQHAAEVLRDIRADRRTVHAPVAVVADIPEKPVDDPHVFFIRGVMGEESLRRAGVERARTVIILGDDKLDVVARDARVVLAALTVESINRDCYTVVELVDGANVPFCERANANEVVVASAFNSMLISRAALDHGVSKVISDLLTTRDGNHLVKIAAPAAMVGQTFFDAFCQMKRTENSIVLGVQNGNEGEVISNPPADYRIRTGDMLITVTH